MCAFVCVCVHACVPVCEIVCESVCVYVQDILKFFFQSVNILCKFGNLF